MYRRSVNLNLNTLPKCGTCGGSKTVIRIPGRVTVYCSKCDKI